LSKDICSNTHKLISNTQIKVENDWSIPKLWAINNYNFETLGYEQM